MREGATSFLTNEHGGIGGAGVSVAFCFGVDVWRH